eukprot:jgi/Mesvir1/26849/Mv20600-RA.1
MAACNVFLGSRATFLELVGERNISLNRSAKSRDAQSRPRQATVRRHGIVAGATSPEGESPAEAKGSGVGFGISNSGAGKGVNQSAAAQKNSEVKRLASKMAKKGKRSDVRPIDPREAMKGRLDYAEVKTWGSGEPDDLGNLQVKDYTPGFKPADPRGSFYKQMVLRLQFLESTGELKVAQMEPLPPFERWSFGDVDYMQFLSDVRVVNRSLEEAIALASRGVPDAGGLSLAVRCFAADAGLDRAQMLERDMLAVSRAWAASTGAASAGPAQRNDGAISPAFPEPSTTNKAYANYIAQIGRGGAGEGVEAEESRLQLLAHAFSIHVTHLTTGMRIGAKATELLGLMEKGGLAYYKEYPQEVRDPLKHFISQVDQAGRHLATPDKMEKVMNELPKALQKTSLLFAPLAVTSPKWR